MRRLTLLSIGLGIVLAGGASVYTLRASGASPGCPHREDLATPIIGFEQAPKSYITVTLTNPNACYGFDNEPVEITLFGPNGRRAISYYGEGPVHGDVGICCNVTLPPHGTWTVRLGAPGASQGLDDIRICNVHVEALRSQGYDVWKRMPEGGNITGHGSFPPGWKDTTKPLPDDPTWREPCETPTAG